MFSYFFFSRERRGGGKKYVSKNPESSEEKKFLFTWICYRKKGGRGERDSDSGPTLGKKS